MTIIAQVATKAKLHICVKQLVMYLINYYYYIIAVGGPCLEFVQLVEGRQQKDIFSLFLLMIGVFIVSSVFLCYF